jgi:tetratricopeptide (TPR) repeat protein
VTSPAHTDSNGPATDLIRRDLGATPGPGLLTACNHATDDDLTGDEADIKSWFTLGLVWLHAGSYDAALATMRRAVAAARRRNHEPSLLRALLVLGYGLAVSSLGGGAESATVQHEAIALAARIGDQRMLGAAELQYALTELLRGQYSRARHWADLAATRSADDPVQTSRIRTIRGTALVDVGRYTDGIAELRAALTGAPVHADPRNAAYALSMLGKAQLLRGDLGAAAATLDQAIHLARVHWIAFRPWPESLRAEVALACGQLDRAEQMFRQAHTLARNFDASPCWESAAARGLGLVAAARGSVDEAVGWFDDAYRHLHRRSVTYEWVHTNALNSLCELAVANALPGASGWIDELEEQAGRLGMHGFLVSSFQHRERLGQLNAGATAALLDADNAARLTVARR